MCAVVQHLHSIDEHVLDANRVLVRIVERGAVGNRCRIKDGDVRCFLTGLFIPAELSLAGLSVPRCELH